MRTRSHHLNTTISGFTTSHRLAGIADQLSKNTNFTSEEAKVLLMIYQKLDAHGNILDRARFREVLSTVFQITDDVMLDLVFHAFDRDADSRINEVDWIRGMSVILRGSLEQLTEFTYTVYDMNGDGSLAREELVHCLKGCLYSGFGIDDEEIEDGEREIVDIALRKLDTDRDGQITRSDFVQAVKNDALLLQACGPCIPNSIPSAAFQSLFTERYKMYSALYPNMRHARKTIKPKKTIPFLRGESRILRPTMDGDATARTSSFSNIPRESRTSNQSELDVSGNQNPPSPSHSLSLQPMGSQSLAHHHRHSKHDVMETIATKRMSTLASAIASGGLGLNKDKQRAFSEPISVKKGKLNEKGVSGLSGGMQAAKGKARRVVIPTRNHHHKSGMKGKSIGTEALTDHNKPFVDSDPSLGAAMTYPSLRMKGTSF